MYHLYYSEMLMQEVQHWMYFCCGNSKETGCMDMSHDDGENEIFDSQVK